MSLEESIEPLAAGEDFGLAGHLASIEQMHQEALAQLDALAKPWGDLWSPRVGLVSSLTEEQSVAVESQTDGAHAAAA